MKEKDFRYSTRLILIVLIVISFIGVTFEYFIKDSDLISYASNNRSIDYIYFDQIDNSLFKQETGYYINRPDLFIDFYIRSYKISNYPFTNEYKAKHKNIVVLEVNDKYEKYQSFNSYESALDYAKRIDEENPRINTDITEEPKYETFYLTNLLSQSEFDPQEMAKESKENTDNVVISGYWQNNKFTFTNSAANYSGDKENIARDLQSAIIYSYDNIYDSGIQKLNFSYTIDTKSTNFVTFVNNMKYEDIMVPSVALTFLGAFCIFMIFGLITNHKKAKEVVFYNRISDIPIEIYAIFVLIWFGFGASGYMLFREYSYYIDNPFSIFYLLQAAGLFIMGIITLHLVYSFKDLVNNKFKSKAIQKSIIIRLFNFIISKSIGVVDKSKVVSGQYLKDVDIGKRKNLIIAYIVSIVFGIIASEIVVYEGLKFIVMILWILFMSVLFVKFQKYVNELETIDRTAKLISEGNYNVKIFEESSSFKSLANNLNAITENLDSAISCAVKSERMKTELIANVSHDLKTPLTSIINYSELILSEENTQEIKKYSKVIFEKSLKLKVLIEDLFEAAKVNSKNIELDIEELDFKQLIKQIIGEWEDKLSEKHIEVVEEYPDSKVLLNLDGVKTSRILDNLFSNIYKYALENTRVYVKLNQGDKVILSIKNISKYPLNISSDELMERFTRGDASRNTEGSGLGLSIAKSLVEIQNGEFDIEIDGDLFKTIIKL